MPRISLSLIADYYTTHTYSRNNSTMSIILPKTIIEELRRKAEYIGLRSTLVQQWSSSSKLRKNLKKIILGR